MRSHHWTIDSVEEEVARVEVDDGRVATVPQWLLPAGARPGDVLRVRLTRDADRSTLEITRDPEAARQAYEASVEQVREWGTAPDPGGDIVL